MWRPRLLLLSALALLTSGCIEDWTDGDLPDRPPARRRRPVDQRPEAADVLVAGDPPAAPADPAAGGWDPAPPATPAATDPPTPTALPPVPPPAVPLAGDPAATPPSPPHLPPGAKAAGTSDQDPLYFSFLAKEPPELASDGVWLTAGVASSLAGLRGQVVYLQFAFQTCPSCALMTPYLQQWHQTYGPQGLTVLYVNNGLMANREAAEKAIKEEGLRFPYFHDEKGETLRAFGVRAFPTAYLIDRNGKVVWEGTPLASEAKLAALIETLLK